MTEVVGPAAAAAPWKSLNGDSRHGDVARSLVDGGIARSPLLNVNKGIAHRSALFPSIGVRFLGRIRGWMVVPAVDFALMLAPIAWRPPQIYATVTMAVVATLLLTGGGRYVSRLHLSVLDELPSIVARLLTAVAAVSAVILYMHQKSQVLTFLETACQAMMLVIIGRVITTRLIAIARRTGIAQHRTVLIGGGPVATELARILGEHREYGLERVGAAVELHIRPIEVRKTVTGGNDDRQARGALPLRRSRFGSRCPDACRTPERSQRGH